MMNGHPIPTDLQILWVYEQRPHKQTRTLLNIEYNEEGKYFFNILMNIFT